MIRVAAVGDVHYDKNYRDKYKRFYAGLGGKADLLLIAGDLTQRGTPEEAQALVADIRESPVPIISVLGNHDFHSGHQDEITRILRESRITVLEGTSTVIKVGGKTVGVMGLKGFGGGFGGACITEFGEPETKAFAFHSRQQAEILRDGLQKLHTDFRLVLMHYSPIEGTLLGEKREIFPFLGSYLLAEAIDEVGADCVFHGHAHLGTEKGYTPGGVPVRNVAVPVIRHAYNIYNFEARKPAAFASPAAPVL